MGRNIKVRKSIGRCKKLVKIERNENIATQIPLHVQLTNPPHSKDNILLVTKKMYDYYTKHLKGDEEATLLMYEAEETLDTYYWDTAEYVEYVANKTNDAALPLSMGFELYATKKTRTKKGIFLVESKLKGMTSVKFTKIKGAGAYMAEAAEINNGTKGNYFYAGSSTVTKITLKNIVPNQKYALRIKGIFKDGDHPEKESLDFTLTD